MARIRARGAGRPTKPTELKILQGTFRPTRAVTKEAKPAQVVPKAPAHLVGEAKAEWGRLSTELASLGLLTRVDRAALAAYCECWADWVDACRMCASKEGMDRKVIKTSAGNFIENPYFSIKKRSAELMHKFIVEFGMTPASRARINVEASTQADQNDPAEKYFG